MLKVYCCIKIHKKYNFKPCKKTSLFVLIFFGCVLSFDLKCQLKKYSINCKKGFLKNEKIWATKHCFLRRPMFGNMRIKVQTIKVRIMMTLLKNSKCDLKTYKYTIVNKHRIYPVFLNTSKQNKNVCSIFLTDTFEWMELTVNKFSSLSSDIFQPGQPARNWYLCVKPSAVHSESQYTLETIQAKWSVNYAIDVV